MKFNTGILKRIDATPAVQSIRQGLVMTIPLLMIGSFALILKFLPIGGYQAFLAAFANGFLLDFFTWVNEVTYGILGVCTTISISYCFARIKSSRTGTILGAVFSSLSINMIFNGLFTDHFNVSSFGAQGMFTAIFSGVVASAVFCRLVGNERFATRLYTVGADADFNNVISVIIPVAVVVVLGALFNRTISLVFEVNGFEALFHKAVNHLFTAIGNSSMRTVLYVALSNFLWFFGVHGTNVLNSVEQAIFPEGAEMLSGVITKPFIDAFVFMGGCGTTISLLVAILLFSRQTNNRGLAKMAAIPMFFNINELMVFGLPIVLNTAFFLPFILTPLACVATGYIAIATGLVPPPQRIEWVTPLLFGGYEATGSVAGLLLQVFNIMMGAMIYRWFLLRYERKTDEGIMSDLDSLIGRMREAEANGVPITLLDLKGREGSVARMLAEDLRHVLVTREDFALFYQPQYSHKDRCVGAEALLRWNHPRCGMIYPPLLIGLAQETGQLGALERIIFQVACDDIGAMQKAGLCPAKISVNATAASLQDKFFTRFLDELLEGNPHVRGVLCIELTEQMSFLLGDAAENKLQAIHDMGILFAVDDFAMGHTSLKYLQSNLFDVVKLDGSLIKNMMNNPRSQEIISSIVRMSETMKFSVLAEYVETIEEKQTLERLGCRLYQGYYYSPAVPLEKLMGRLRKEWEAPA